MEAMEFVVGEPEQKPVVEILGPFRGDIYRLLVDGCTVPYIELMKNTDPQHEWEEGFEWHLVLDRRFGLFAHREEIERWGWWLANAMAVSAGFTSHGPNSRRSNPFSVQAIGLDELPEPPPAPAKADRENQP